MEKTNHWSVHLEFAVLFLTLIGGFFTLHTSLDGKIERQGERIDKLYEMYAETQKEIKQVYLDLFKERK